MEKIISNKHINKWGILILEIISLSALIYGIFFFTAIQAGSAFILYAVITCFGIAIGYHRLLSHNSFKTTPLITKILSCIGCLSLQGSPLVWVINHRTHHAFTDTERDPHTPTNGILSAFFLGSFGTSKASLGKDFLRDKFQLFLHKYYFLFIISYTSIIYTFTNLDWTMALIFAPAGGAWLAVNLVNTIGHLPYLGYKNYKLINNSSNNILVNLLSFGEGYHNNHHAEPNNPNFSHKPYEFDLSYYFIKKLQTV